MSHKAHRHFKARAYSKGHAPAPFKRDMDFDAIHRACTDKTRYWTRREAKHVAVRIGLNFYRCPFCGCWHLTSEMREHYTGRMIKEGQRTHARHDAEDGPERDDDG